MCLHSQAKVANYLPTFKYDYFLSGVKFLDTRQRPMNTSTTSRAHVNLIKCGHCKKNVLKTI